MRKNGKIIDVKYYRDIETKKEISANIDCYKNLIQILAEDFIKVGGDIYENGSSIC